MEFWINNGNTYLGVNGNLDADLPVPPYPMNYLSGLLVCPRDLENVARLWICGMPSLPSSQNYTVTLSMAAVTGSPAINLYNSVETNGGIGYLTDTNIAAEQTAFTLSGGVPVSGAAG